MTNQEVIEKRVSELDKMIQKGKDIIAFKKTPAYLVITEWVKKEGNVNKIYKSLGESRTEAIGYTRFAVAFLQQLGIWEQVADKKQKELTDLLEKEDANKK